MFAVNVVSQIIFRYASESGIVALRGVSNIAG